MRRALALLLVIAGLLPTTWLGTGRPPPSPEIALDLTRVPLPSRAAQEPLLGPFRLKGVWHMTSPHRLFGGYSALLALDEGRFLALSDRGILLLFSAPGTPQEPEILETIFSRQVKGKEQRDFEAATRDPETGIFWTAIENANVIARQHFTGKRLRLSGLAAPSAMAGWAGNEGPEAMTRLPDGRFIVLREAFVEGRSGERHEALLFARDPVEDSAAQGFTAVGPAGYKPTDMAQLPDGRMLVLMRRLVRPFPAAFDCLLAMADPADIVPGGEWHLKTVARLSNPLPVDNYEGLAIVPHGEDGQVAIWIISDENTSAFQRTLLMQLTLDPADLR